MKCNFSLFIIIYKNSFSICKWSDHLQRLEGKLSIFIANKLNVRGENMKIDIHVHTKKTKSGDSQKRNIDAEQFVKIIMNTEVKILAITNHNHFDINQYHDFVSKASGICQIWPGVELDIIENNRRGHLLVIVNPKNADRLSEKLSELLKVSNEEKFNITIEDTIKNFDNMDSIYIPHYYAKKPCLVDEDIEKISELVGNDKRVIKEATNSISAGIYISHGHKSIYGSDVQDWEEYAQISNSLPELRLPVESFEHFCLLLDKDEPTINTILDQKKHEQIRISPFGEDNPIELNIYNDINVFFGSKGTGKSEILKAISKHYNESGLNTKVYESNAENLEDFFDIKGKELNVRLDELSIESCENEISEIKSACDKSVTNLSNYVKFFTSKVNNVRANSIIIKDFTTSDTANLERRFTEIKDVYKEITEFWTFTDENTTFKEAVGIDLLEELNNVLNKIDEKIIKEQEIRFIDSKATKMFNELITIFNNIISRKTGKPTKPISTGFQSYARNRIRIERIVNKLLDNIEKKIDLKKQYVGSLGMKGRLDCITEIKVQDGNINNGKYNTLKKVNKTPQKEFSKTIRLIKDSLYSSDLFEKISMLVSISGIDDIKDIDDLLVFYRYFAINNITYRPSSGESSMLLLHNELSEDKDIYFLDEPEKSLGNDYINDEIVPLLKERAKQGKKIIIATHDANIAIRTLPYNSIYRKHEIDSYCTYVGNPFSNNLVNINDSSKLLDWKDISMKTLEGGKEAFGERGKIYGNI